MDDVLTDAWIGRINDRTAALSIADLTELARLAEAAGVVPWTPYTPPTAWLSERLEQIAAAYMAQVRGVRMRERDYTNWLYLDLALAFGRERLLGGLGVTTDDLQRALADDPLANELVRRLAGDDHYPDVVLFSENLTASKHWRGTDIAEGYNWSRLDVGAPPVDAFVELRIPAHKEWRAWSAYRHDVVKLAALGAFVRRELRQEMPYLSLWILDVLGHGGERGERAHALFGRALTRLALDPRAVRVVVFSPSGTATVLREGGIHHEALAELACAG